MPRHVQVEQPPRSSARDSDDDVVAAASGAEAALLVPPPPEARVRTRAAALELKRAWGEGREEKGSEKERWRRAGVGAAAEKERRWWAAANYKIVIDRWRLRRLDIKVNLQLQAHKIAVQSE